MIAIGSRSDVVTIAVISSHSKKCLRRWHVLRSLHHGKEGKNGGADRNPSRTVCGLAVADGAFFWHMPSVVAVIAASPRA